MEVFSLSLSLSSGSQSLKQSFLKRSRNLFASVGKAFALIFALTLIGCGGGGGGSSGGGDDDSGGGGDPVSYNVSFYDANLDFNGSKSVEANSPINIALLKTELDLNASALYLASETTNRISVTSYPINGNVNFYATPNVQEIRTQTELNNTRNDLSGKYILLNDINLTSVTLDDSYGWNPIGDDSNLFTGIFNGNGYAVRNLWIDRTGTNYVGLFGYALNAKIRNLGVEIDNSKGGVKGSQYVGAIAGRVYQFSSITNSYSTGNVSGVDYIGGIAGYVYNNSYITDSYASGNVSGDDSVGGIAGGLNDADIVNSYATGNVSGDDDVGAIAGHLNDDSNIVNSYATGNVSGLNYTGGIAGTVYYGSSVTNSYSTGNVNGTNVYAGGIAGYVDGGSSVTNTYSIGNVSGYNSVGGIAGYAIAGSGIANNAAINNSVNGSEYVNRVIGFIFSSSATNNFSLVEMTINGVTYSGSSNDQNGTSKVIANFKTQETYSADPTGGLGWKFGNDNANPWKIDAGKNDGYPYLYWQE